MPGNHLLYSRSVYNNTHFDKLEAFWVLRPDGPSIPRGRVVIEPGKTKRVELELNERYLKPREKTLEDSERGLKEWEKRKNRRLQQQRQQQQQQQRQEKNGTDNKDEGNDNKETDAAAQRRRQVFLIVRKVEDRFCASAEEHLVEGEEATNFSAGLSSSSRTSSSSSSRTSNTNKRNQILRDGEAMGRVKPLVFPAGSRA